MMKRRRNKNLRVVNEQDDPTDKIVEDLIRELKDEDALVPDPDAAVREIRRKRRRKNILVAVAILALAIGVYLLVSLPTYGNVRVSATYSISGAGNSNYTEFENGILKYSKDGIAYLNQKGEEAWNQSYQIKTPVVRLGHSSAVVYDQGGNAIVVFGKDGVKGEIETTMPIECVAVSKQGIVGTILKNDSSAMVMCYDTAGNVLVEHKTSLSGTGYPMDIALSDDGETMQVLYLYTQEGKIVSKVVFYNFGKDNEDSLDHQVLETKYNDTIMMSGFFLNETVSAAVGDNCLALYSGTTEPKEIVKISIDKEIKSVFHSEAYIGMILKNESEDGNELRLYNTNGKVVLSENFTGEYSDVKISKDQVIMYDGKKCSIFLKSGIHRFEGSMENNILEIVPVAGVNKYIVINANGMEKVRLVK